MDLCGKKIPKLTFEKGRRGPYGKVKKELNLK